MALYAMMYFVFVAVSVDVPSAAFICQILQNFALHRVGNVFVSCKVPEVSAVLFVILLISLVLSGCYI